MSPPRPEAIETETWLSALSHILTLNRPDTLIICTSQETILETLIHEVTSQQSPDLSILQPTIARLSASSEIQAVFTSSLMHMRAYLSSINHKTSTTVTDKQAPFFAILGLPQLHLMDNELNAQNFSRTLALAVEAGKTGGGDVLFLCPRRMSDYHELDALERQQSVWERKVPILGNIKGDERGWSGRNVMLGDIFEQWCRVSKVNEG